jgi:hypothetical protein
MAIADMVRLGRRLEAHRAAAASPGVTGHH